MYHWVLGWLRSSSSSIRYYGKTLTDLLSQPSIFLSGAVLKGVSEAQASTSPGHPSCTRHLGWRANHQGWRANHQEQAASTLREFGTWLGKRAQRE